MSDIIKLFWGLIRIQIYPRLVFIAFMAWKVQHWAFVVEHFDAVEFTRILISQAKLCLSLWSQCSICNIWLKTSFFVRLFARWKTRSTKWIIARFYWRVVFAIICLWRHRVDDGITNLTLFKSIFLICVKSKNIRL